MGSRYRLPRAVASALTVDGLPVLSNEELFTAISKEMIKSGTVRSALSDTPAEIFHHIERRLTNPLRVLDPTNLVPLTTAEHSAVHANQIVLTEKDGVVFCTDYRWGRVVHFRLYLDDFRKAWEQAAKGMA